MRTHSVILSGLLLSVGLATYAQETPVVPNDGVYVFKADETQYRSPFDKLPVPVPVIEDVNKDGSLSATKMEVRELEKPVKANKIEKTVKREVRPEPSKAKEGTPVTLSKVEASVIPPIEQQNTEVKLVPPTIKNNEPVLTSFAKPVETVKSKEMPEPTTESSGLPTWVYKAMMFFGVGLLLLATVWYGLRRQALYGDPALKDPWFKPVQ